MTADNNARSMAPGATETTPTSTTSLAATSDGTGQGVPLFQPMPELNPEQFDSLRADIAQHGVLVPIVVDQHGRIIDGHHRAAFAAELGIDCPRKVRPVADDADAWDLAVTLNCARRHLTREQTREVIAAELRRRPADSDRAIARRVGCSHPTVAAVRWSLVDLGDVESLSTRTDSIGRQQPVRRPATKLGARPEWTPPPLTRAEAGAGTVEIQRGLAGLRECYVQLAVELLSNAVVSAEDVAEAIAAGWGPEEPWPAEDDRSKAAGWVCVRNVVRQSVVLPVLDWLRNPATAQEWRQWGHPAVKPGTDAERAKALGTLAAFSRRMADYTGPAVDAEGVAE